MIRRYSNFFLIISTQKTFEEIFLWYLKLRVGLSCFDPGPSEPMSTFWDVYLSKRRWKQNSEWKKIAKNENIPKDLELGASLGVIEP